MKTSQMNSTSIEKHRQRFSQNNLHRHSKENSNREWRKTNQLLLTCILIVTSSANRFYCSFSNRSNNSNKRQWQIKSHKLNKQTKHNIYTFNLMKHNYSLSSVRNIYLRGKQI